MSEALAAVVPGSVLVLDVDSTMLTTSQMLGNDAWLRHYIRAKATEYIRSGMEREAAVKKAFDEAFSIWERVHAAGAPTAVETETPRLIRELQQSRIPAMILSAARHGFMAGRREELAKLGIDMALGAPSPGRLRLSPGVDYADGILLNTFQDKGEALVRYFERSGYRPTAVVFVDDDAKNVESVDRALAAAGIPALCFRYGALDGMYERFDVKVADVQLERFLADGRLISDEEARRVLAGRPFAAPALMRPVLFD